MTETARSFYAINGSPVEADKVDLPASGLRFSGAWTGIDTDGRPAFDLAKGRDIIRDEVRAARAARWYALDVELLRAVETGNEVQLNAVKGRRTLARNAPAHPAIDAIDSVEALEAFVAESVLPKVV